MLTHLVMVLDKSGSMGPYVDDTVNGYNNLLKEQAALGAESIRVSTILFDTRFVWHAEWATPDEAKLEHSKYTDGGMGSTALVDAMGQAITKGDFLGNANEPDKTIVAVFTDGYENASREYTSERIREMVKDRQEVWSWEFLFIGAGIDAWSQAGKVGISVANTLDGGSNAAGHAVSYNNVSSYVGRTRAGAQSNTFTDDEQVRSLHTKRGS